MSDKNILQNAEEYMTREYDSQFKSVKGLEWDPWVGKDYQTTGIFVVGMSTDERHGNDWTQNLANPRDASRTLAAWLNTPDDEPFYFDNDGKSFKKMAHIFTDYAGWDRGVNAYAAFWQSVAFNNFFQVAVPNIGDIPEQPKSDKDKHAFHKTIDIIKPKLILVWKNNISRFGPGQRPGDKMIGHITPYVIEQQQHVFIAPIVGMGHPSRLKQSACIEFLLDDRASKKPIQEFINHLKQQLN